MDKLPFLFLCFYTNLKDFDYLALQDPLLKLAWRQKGDPVEINCLCGDDHKRHAGLNYKYLDGLV